MKTIWKYPIEVGSNVIEIPEGAEILYVALQRHTPTIWCLVDTDQPERRRHINVYGTGHVLLNDLMKYVGTFGQSVFVWHVFDEGEEDLGAVGGDRESSAEG